MKRGIWVIPAMGAWLLLAAVFVFLAGCEKEEPDNPWDEEKGSPVYEVFEMDIRTAGDAPVVSRENEDYLDCTVSLDGKDILDDYQGTARIRGRGNSSWLWYEKKSYRIKLNEPFGILGLKSNRDWVLLANYRDPTDLMNAFGFEAASWLGLPYTNHTRFVEVTLNGDFIGLYQLTEQVEQGGNRVDVDDTDGWLISLDLDDGPELSPDASDNFSSTEYRLPVCVKYPENPSAGTLDTVRFDFARLEKAIRDYNFDSVASLLDIPSFINYLILQELVYNVELAAPRSVFMHKEAGGKYVMGPVWDFDAGFDFDWGTMVTGHNYFNAQELVLGTDPANHRNGYRISNFFTQMFRNQQFVLEYKSRWEMVKDSIFNHTWQVMEKYQAGLQDALARDFQRWPIDRNYMTETTRMKDWLSQRVAHLNSIVGNYPEGTVPTTRKDCGTISCDVTMSYKLGYNQNVTVNVDESTLLSKLDITREQLYRGDLNIVPLKTDGSDGENNTNGVFGGWFEADDNPGYWAYGHVYIEVFDNLTVWNCGLRAEEGFCSAGEKHTVRMQYQFTAGTETRTVTVIVNFTIAA